MIPFISDQSSLTTKTHQKFAKRGSGLRKEGVGVLRRKWGGSQGDSFFQIIPNYVANFKFPKTLTLWYFPTLVVRWAVLLEEGFLERIRGGIQSGAGGIREMTSRPRTHGIIYGIGIWCSWVLWHRKSIGSEHKVAMNTKRSHRVFG